jgi:hypothetical protein
MDAGIRKPLEELTPAETRARAREYELLARTVVTARVRDTLLAFAWRLYQRAAEDETRGAA